MTTKQNVISINYSGLGGGREEEETIIETLCLLQLTEVHFSSLDKEVVKTDNYGNAINSLKEDRSCHKKVSFFNIPPSIQLCNSEATQGYYCVIST